MAERYSRLFSLTENLYALGSPVVIAAGALLKDNQTGKIIAQLKLRNIGNKEIKALTVSVRPFDTIGNPVGESVQYQYLDLNVWRDENFGSKTPIFLPNRATRSFAASVTEVAFTDNTVWRAHLEPWEPLAIPSSISNVYGAEFEKQFCLEYGTDCVNLPLLEKDLWHCACGALNHQKEIICHSCKKSFSSINSYNVDELNEKKNKRLAAEKEKAEYEAELGRIRTAKIVKQAKKIAVITAGFGIVLLICILTVMPAIKYSEADKMVAEGQYDKAIRAYRAIDDSPRTEARIDAANYARAEALLADGKYLAAISQFKKLGDYKDAEEQSNAARYAYGVDLLSKGEYQSASYQFKLLGDYKDAKEQMKNIDDTVNQLRREISVELVEFDTSDNLESIFSSISRSGNYLDLSFKFNSSNPKKSYTLNHKVQWPGEGAELAEWKWEDVKSGDIKGCAWKNGYKAKTSGKLIIEVLIDGTDIVIGKFEMTIK